MKFIIDIPERDYLECVKRVEDIREKGYMIENLKYKIIIADGTPLEEELKKIKEEIKPLPITDTAIRLVSNIIDNHISELKGENK